ncbi:MAG: hypothetical protein H6707_13515 [Deltaproteobacteria bacterium]|nr:hypothetical protein [Deltaproteobacteria bacterium]
MSARQRFRLLAFALLGLCLAPQLVSAEPPFDEIRDTHQRIDRIAERIGFRQRQERKRSQGCSAQAEHKPSNSKSSFKLPSMPPVVGYVLLAVIVAAMLIPLFMALGSGYRDLAPVTRAGVDHSDDDSTAAQRARLPWHVELADCRALFERGEGAAALAALHRYLLLRLADRGLLQLDGSTTNWEYVRSLSPHPRFKRMLAAVTEAAERAVLGVRGQQPAGYDELESRVQELV